MTTDTLGNKQAIVKVRWLTQNSGLETWRDGGRVTPDTGHVVWWRPGGPTELQEEQEGAQQLRCTLSPAWLSSAQVRVRDPGAASSAAARPPPWGRGRWLSIFA